MYRSMRQRWRKKYFLNVEWSSWQFLDVVDMEFIHEYNKFMFNAILQVDVHCFLLTDILLICKTTTKKGTGNLKVMNKNTIIIIIIIHNKTQMLSSENLHYVFGSVGRRNFHPREYSPITSYFCCCEITQNINLLILNTFQI